MKLAYIDIKNFRGISAGRIFFSAHTVIIGDNNAGKSTIFEAIDLVLGPDRLKRIPVVDEHDFYNGDYYNKEGDSPKIEIELLVIDLSDEQIALFKNNLEFWNVDSKELLQPGELDKTDSEDVVESLRFKFVGEYDPEEDDFAGNTYFCSPQRADKSFGIFSQKDKKQCGFLYLRALRTGSRALSMERGSLLDIILRLRELRPKMWEDVLGQLKKTDVATDPTLGVTNILEGVQEALKNFVPTDWGSEPILRVSDLTREHLRRTLTIFMSTGTGTYHAPFHHQGTGTINTMVLALLSMIAEAKKNVIFAMEEPEIAIPPYTQKRIVDSIRTHSTQALFTSHSPFVLEEFPPEQIVLIQRDKAGKVNSQAVHFPKTIKPKTYSAEFRMRFAESLLAKKILLTEGHTEAAAYATAARRLGEQDSSNYTSFEAMGIAIFNVMSETAVAPYGNYFQSLGKKVFAVFDEQEPADLTTIKTAVNHPFEQPYKGFEKMLTEELPDAIIKQYIDDLIAQGDWPTASDKFKPVLGNADEYQKALLNYLKRNKGSGAASDLLALCKAPRQFPSTIRKVLKEIKTIVD